MINNNFSNINCYNEIYFELSNICNMSHIHKKCPLYLERNNPIILSTDIILNILKELNDMKYENTIGFHTYNEPLMDDRLYFLIKETRNLLKNNNIYLCTNGILLNQEVLDELVNIGVTKIHVSIYSEKDYNRLINLKCDIEYIIERVKLDDRLNFYDLNYHNENKKCNRMKQLIISRTGKITLCCLDWKRVYDSGDFNIHTLKEMLTDENFLTIRNDLYSGNRNLDYCKKCLW